MRTRNLQRWMFLGMVFVLGAGCFGNATTVPGVAEDSESDPVPVVEDVEIPNPE